MAEDPTEQGIRAVLNLGHSIGHALETATSYRAFSHGEAVAIGLLPALWLSIQVCGLDPAVEQQVRELLELHELPTAARNVDPEAVLEAMRRDKKARGGRVWFALLERVGKPVFGVDPGDDLISQAVGRAIVA